ncbi:MAG TPA: COX15/CtaA family protein [Casimicrobiaceae bacterium]|jgi:cytochrome c oxidase assembly protein subunit 15
MATPYSIPVTHVQPRADASVNRSVARWLFVCCALVFAMVVVGGVTRLTHSGLSITEWQPIIGAVPPMSDAQWQETFAKYKLTPEFRQINNAMTLSEFKGIFWWEYLHRLLGRVIGLVFFVPLVWFIASRRISSALAAKLFGIFALGAAQGALGWYMVQSGLIDDPRVSPFRLTAHLGLAFAILGAMLWTAMTLRMPQHAALDATRQHTVRRLAFLLVAVVCVMVISGGFVAGIRAGFAYNTFPLMNGHIVPPEILMLDPSWTNLFWNMATVQFDHRVLALILVVVALLLWWRLRVTPGLPSRAVRGGNALLAMLVLQIGLGIATLLYVVPLPLAALHQGGALLTFMLALNVAHALR